MRWKVLMIGFWMLIAACAQVRQIEGGEKDVVAPKVLSATPPNFSTGFTGQRIVLQFDERVQLDRVRDRMLISPPLEKLPNVRIAKATQVVIELQEPLAENTTYSFAIGEVVKDLTEGNQAAGLTYVVSTGPALDSMAVQGRVVNAFTGAAEKGVLVSLYDQSDTLTIRNGRPSYVTRSDAEGRFAMYHLRNGSYALNALQDKNANFLYDLPNESLAFMDSTVFAEAPDSTMNSYTLRLFVAESPAQSIREARVTPDGALRLVFARRAEEIRVRDVARDGGRLSWYQEWSAERDSLLLWPSDTTALDDGRYEVRNDSIVLDTLRYRPTSSMPYVLGVRTAVRELPTGPRVEITTARPLGSVDSTLFRLERDSLPLDYHLERDSVDLRRLYLHTDLPPGSSATLSMLPKALKDIYGRTNDSMTVGLGRAAEQSTGILRFRLDERSKSDVPMIMQLLDSQGRIVRSSTLEPGERSMTWERLTPGNHSLRMILDRNGNGRWDTGDPNAGTQPEVVIPHDGTINVRAAWDLAIDLELE